MSPIKPENAKDPDDYIAQIDDEARRADIVALDRLIREEAPELDRHLAYGMLGYGPVHYRYESGREGDGSLIGLASQKRHISLYVCVTDGDGLIAGRYEDRLPRANFGKGCVRFTRLDRVDEDVLRELVREAAARFAKDPDFAYAQ